MARQRIGKEPMTATQRGSRARSRAAAVMPTVALDAAALAKLKAILAASGETYAGWVRRMIAAA